MRLFIVPFILVAILVQAPAPALGNNQEAAEKIAGVIGTNFPDADIDVAYQGGQVWLKGDAVSAEQRTRIVEHVRNVPGINVTEVNNEIQIAAPRVAVGIPARTPAQTPRSAATAFTTPAPIPNPAQTNPVPMNSGIASPVAGVPAPIIATSDRQPPPPPPQMPQVPPQLVQMYPQMPVQQFVPHPQPMTAMTGADLAQYPLVHYPAAYGMRPGQEPVHPYPYMPTSFVPVGQEQPIPMHQHPQQHQPAYHGHHGPLPGQYNQPHLPDYAWPAYANYPNYAQVSYPRSYSPKAWPYIGPFYPYPQVPMGWRKVTLEHSNGWWWLDFDDGSSSGPFSALFRHPQQYRY